jgi:hypothetical protein
MLVVENNEEAAPGLIAPAIDGVVRDNLELAFRARSPKLGARG